MRVDIKIIYAIILLLVIIAIDALFIEPYRLIITENNFDLFDGADTKIRIILISDIHIGSQRDGYLDEVVNKINNLEPDIILIAGDSINHHEIELSRLAPLKKLRTRYGAFAVLGNHDYGWWGCPISQNEIEMSNKVEKRIEELGITVMRNENKIIEINGKRFALIGLDDVWVCKNDYKKASENVSDTLPKIIFMHNSKSIDPQQVTGKSLILAGHTHCGQIRIPFVTESLLVQGEFGHITGGKAQLDSDTEIYTTCGVTQGSMNIRFLTNPEISTISIE
ncbi:metallophosphoesterase [Candidatus Micrarchaeota archaeon]|nr:metallophosphoesterase [Candidatus Micrarchaeota archaeon]